MKYISDDGKIFNTESECHEYEQKQKRKAELKKMQKERYDNICKHHTELMKEIDSYVKDYRTFSEFQYNGLAKILSELCRVFG